MVVEEFVGSLMVGDSLSLPIPFKPGFGVISDVGQQGGAGAAMADLNVARALLPTLDAVQEIASVGDGVAGGITSNLFGFDKRLSTGTILLLRIARERRARGEFILGNDLGNDFVAVALDVKSAFGAAEFDFGRARG